MGEATIAERRFRRETVLHRVVRDPPAATDGLVSVGATFEVGVGQLVAERLVWVLSRVFGSNVALADKVSPAVQASRSRKGSHGVSIVSGVE